MILRRVGGIAIAFVLFQTGVVVSLGLLLPTLPLLLMPGVPARRSFCWWSGNMGEAWFGMAVALLRYGLGVQIFIHTPLEKTLACMAPGGVDVLVISNHRSRVDWMFLWGLAAAMGRLGGFKIVLKDSLRKVPGVGWATQCLGFAFMRRNDREADLATLQSTVKVHGDIGAACGHPLLVLLFPEGTDLSENNVAKAHDYADKHGLPRHDFVLHPKTAGLVATWEALKRAAKAREGSPPVLLDVTLGYVDYQPGERPNEFALFLQGRCCREVHIFCEVVGEAHSPESDVAALCRNLFMRKEQRLRDFYGGLDQGLPASAVWANSKCMSLESVPGVMSTMCGGIIFIASVEVAAVMIARRVGLVCTFLGLACGCAAFVAAGSMTGGIDRAILWHAHQWSGERQGDPKAE